MTYRPRYYRRPAQRRDAPTIIGIAVLYVAGFLLASVLLIPGLLIMLAACILTALRFPYRRY